MRTQFIVIIVASLLLASNSEMVHAGNATQVVINMLLLDDNDSRISKDISMTWSRPFQREDDSSLGASDIDHYQIRYRKSGTEHYRFLIIYSPDLAANLTLRGELADQYELSIRVVDTNGLSSRYTESVLVAFND